MMSGRIPWACGSVGDAVTRGVDNAVTRGVGNGVNRGLGNAVTRGVDNAITRGDRDTTGVAAGLTGVGAVGVDGSRLVLPRLIPTSFDVASFLDFREAALLPRGSRAALAPVEAMAPADAAVAVNAPAPWSTCFLDGVEIAPGVSPGLTVVPIAPRGVCGRPPRKYGTLKPSAAVPGCLPVCGLRSPRRGGSMRGVARPPLAGDRDERNDAVWLETDESWTSGVPTAVAAAVGVGDCEAAALEASGPWAAGVTGVEVGAGGTASTGDDNAVGSASEESGSALNAASQTAAAASFRLVPPIPAGVSGSLPRSWFCHLAASEILSAALGHVGSVDDSRLCKRWPKATKPLTNRSCMALVSTSLPCSWRNSSNFWSISAKLFT
mmetsp:Transcript_49893/g.139638  ORF Transcript_49893/g.139638 Transcript_49893/m.139638 type:complete len:380 (+) Transcript_49893:1120-2259(+)